MRCDRLHDSVFLTVEFTVEYYPHMETVQVVLDQELLRAADRAARRVKINRSALVRDALRAYLKQLHYEEKERRDREGYERYPDSEDDLAPWEQVAAWPQD